MKNKFKVMISYVCAFIGMMFSFIGGCMLDSENLIIPFVICTVGFVFLGVALFLNRGGWYEFWFD